MSDATNMNGEHLYRFINEACRGEITISPSTFIPSRFPYTYACDYIRAHTNRGRTNELSRAEASGLMRTYAEHHFDGDYNTLATALAMRFLALNNIRFP
jgi:hypothetical protein